MKWTRELAASGQKPAAVLKSIRPRLQDRRHCRTDRADSRNRGNRDDSSRRRDSHHCGEGTLREDLADVANRLYSIASSESDSSAAVDQTRCNSRSFSDSPKLL